jgi:hypothetical protein
MLLFLLMLINGPLAPFAFVVSGFVVLLIPVLLSIAFSTSKEHSNAERGWALGCAFVLVIPVIIVLVGLATLWV